MNSPQPSSPSRRFPIWLFIGGSAIFNFLLPLITEAMFSPTGFSATRVVWIGLIAGVITGQLTLLTIWAVVGPPSALVRLPLTTMVGMFLVACLAAGIAAAVGTVGPLGEIAPTFLFLPLVFLSAQLPLWVLKLITGGHIVRVDAKTGQMPTVKRQFGIGHLMGATVVLALALGLASSGVRLTGVRSFGPEGPIEGMEGMIWISLAAPCVVSCLFTLFVTLPCLWAGLGAKNPRAGAVGLAIYAGLMVLLLVGIFALFAPGPMPGEAVVMLLFFSGSLMFVTLGTLYVARFCGYRYRHGSRPQPVVAVGSPFASCDETPPSTEAAPSPTFDAERPPESDEAAE